MEHPFTMVVSGQTGCGKTHFIGKLLEHNTNFSRIIFAYTMFQPIYKKFLRIPCLELHEGFPEDLELDGTPTLLILDDMMMENDKLLAKFFTRMRHANLSTIFVMQNFYFDSKYMRTVTRNAHYLVLFSNPRDMSMINCLGRQMFPEKSKFLPDAFRQATEKPFGYLFLDCKPNSKYRVKEGVFPDEEQFIYKPA